MVHTGLSNECVKQSTALLNGLLANHFTLLLKTWQFHWNVVGQSFSSYHEAMEKLYTAEINRVDDTAERIRALGERPLGSMKSMLECKDIKEFCMSEALPEAIVMWQMIRDDWDTMIRIIREKHEQVPAEDLGTINFLEDMIESMEKEAWMIRADNVTRSAT